VIKFDVFKRWTSEVQFTAEIDCAEDAPISVKRGLAVKWAVENRVSLDGAILNSAILNGASLDRAALTGACLKYASFRGSSFQGAILGRAILRHASFDGAIFDDAIFDHAYLDHACLTSASFERARFEGASLRGARLDYACLTSASFERASLRGARLKDARFGGARLNHASIEGVSGVNDYIKCIHIDTYPITYTADVMQIGCERHAISEWREFDDTRIARMDGKKSVKFWRKYKAWIFQALELCPAKPTGGGT